MLGFAPNIPVVIPEPATGDIDASTEEGATRLARQIRGFWLSQGFDVRVDVERISVQERSGKTYPHFRIVTDLVNGTPRRRLPKGMRAH